MDERASTTVELRGVNLKVVGHSGFWTEMAAERWETATLDVFDRYLPHSDLFVDIGGWIGPTSLYASRHCGRIIAFEPDPAARAAFARNIAVNDLTSIELRPEAVSPHVGAAEMWDGGTGMGNSISSMIHGRGERFTVDTLTPARIKAMIGPDETYFIKMDIEGGEYAALEAISALFGERLTGMLVAFHPRFIGGRKPWRWPITLPKTLSAFRNFPGFEIYQVTERGRRRARLQEWLAKANLPLFEAKDTYLFVPPDRT
jgi:FkbM family methyltransferase